MNSMTGSTADRLVYLMSQTQPAVLHSPPSPIGTWLVIGYALLVAVLLTYAAHISLTAVDSTHRDDAYRVLKLVSVIATGTGGLLTTVIRMSDAGLLL